MSIKAHGSSNFYTPIVDSIGYPELLDETRLVLGDSPNHDHYLPFARAAAARDMPHEYVPDPVRRPAAQFFEYPGGHNFYAEIVAADVEAFGIGEAAVHGDVMAEVTVLTPSVADAHPHDLAA